MSATIDVTVVVDLLSLGKSPNFIDKATDGTTPDTYVSHLPTLASANSEEALDMGDISTAQLLVIRAIDYDLDVDLDFDTSFDADFTLKAGEPAAVIPNPSGTIKVKNATADQAPQYEYLLIGTT